MADVFISYARSERPQAEIIKSLLEGAGLSVFFDVQGLDGGDVFPDILDREVKSAGVVLGLWSPHALSRPWVKIECLIGKDRGVLVPASVAPINPLIDVPAAFYGLQHIDLSDFQGDTSDPNWRALLRSLGRTLNQPDLVERAVTPTQADAAGDADLRAQMERMRDELAALRGTLSDTPTTPAPQPEREPDPAPEPAAAGHAAPDLASTNKPLSIHEEAEPETGSSLTGVALATAALISLIRIDVTDWLSLDLSPGAPLIALVAAAKAPAWARYLLAFIFVLSIVDTALTDLIYLGSSQPGLSVLAALICVFNWRPLVEATQRWPVYVAMVVYTVTMGTFAITVFFYPNEALLTLLGTPFLALGVIALASGARSRLQFVVSIGIAFACIGLNELLGLACVEIYWTADDFELFVEPARVRLVPESVLSIALASYAVWLLTRPVSKEAIRLALGLCIVCLVWVYLAPAIGDVLGGFIAALEPRASADAEVMRTQSVVVVVGTRISSFELNIVVALAASLLWGRLMASRTGWAFGMPALIGLPLGTAFMLTAGDATPYVQLGVLSLAAVWIGRSGFMGTADSGSRA